MTNTTNQMLDEIAEKLSHYRSATLLNAVHACRPGHPLNQAISNPFSNLRFMMSGWGNMGLTAKQLRWIDGQAAEERSLNTTT